MSLWRPGAKHYILNIKRVSQVCVANTWLGARLGGRGTFRRQHMAGGNRLGLQLPQFLSSSLLSVGHEVNCMMLCLTLSLTPQSQD